VDTFTDADSAYRHAIEAPGRELPAASAAARRVASIDLSGDDISRAVLMRLKSFFLAQARIKAELGKVYAAPAADFFVETVVFYLRAALERLAPDLTVAAERNIVKGRGAMRPDISIWRGERVVAAIECKTQLGWNRDGWLRDFEDRESRLRDEFPAARLFLLVMTGSNWPGFGEDSRAQEQFFVLLREIWPRDFDEASSTLIEDRVESLIERVVNHANQVSEPGDS
jgi:hypothetical protein